VAREVVRGYGARGIAIATVALLALAVGVLSVLAYQHARPGVDPGDAAPVPTFTLGVQTAPTPTPPAPNQLDPAAERFLSLGSAAWWRGTAGRCGQTEPVLERSTDGGATWVDVTPRYRAVAQIQSLDAFTSADAEMVATTGHGCLTEALRTFTEGEFWESYPDVLAVSRYVDPADAAVVHLGPDTVAAPCATASGLRAQGDIVALVCDATAFVWRSGQWEAFPSEGVAAVATDSESVAVAHSSEACAGVTITRFDGADPEAGTDAGCLTDLDPKTATALAISGDRFVVWSGDGLASTP
jgi:hypothetical protein